MWLKVANKKAIVNSAYIRDIRIEQPSEKFQIIAYGERIENDFEEYPLGIFTDEEEAKRYLEDLFTKLNEE